ncbi:hypothetical protein R1flu_004545 [Riccia fluitans]|uniref:Uncharacterized protein n=1 Tax=Riccia fluitans TaxID=41844 RepID=A0ABD1YR49_9MARC
MRRSSTPLAEGPWSASAKGSNGESAVDLDKFQIRPGKFQNRSACVLHTPPRNPKDHEQVCESEGNLRQSGPPTGWTVNCAPK